MKIVRFLVDGYRCTVGHRDPLGEFIPWTPQAVCEHCYPVYRIGPTEDPK